MSQQAKPFADKVVLITGGTSGIGRESAIAFAQEGARLVVSGRRQKEGEETVALVEKAGGRASFIQADVADETQVKSMIAHTIKTFGRLDVVFANAGLEWTGPISSATPEDFRRVMDVNVLGVVLTAKHALAELAKSKGNIVITSSGAGVVGMPNVSLYVAAKHAVIGLAKSLALEFAPQGVRVNVISPAAIQTEMFSRFANTPEMLKAVTAMHPIGRIGTVREIADAVLFAASDKASFMTGSNILVDGGFTAQ